jgi:hypothetical protein
MNGRPDKRLFTLRNLSASEAGGDGHEVYEFEVFCEVPTNGEFRRGPFALVPWDAEPAPSGFRRSLLLTIANHLPDEHLGASKAPTKGGFYHGVSMQAEFCALATALLRRRIDLGPLVRARDIPIRVPLTGRRRHNQLVSGEIKLNDLDTALDALRALPEEHHQMFILACRMYQEALTQIDEKPDLAYLLLVSAIEVFVAKMGQRTKESELAPELLAALGKIPDETSRRLVVDRILDLDRGISRNFVAFVVDLVSDDFWNESPNLAVEKGRIEASELSELLYRVYNQRSKTLHEAEPFPPNVMEPPDTDAEIDRSEGISVGQRRWTQSQMIPYVRFFERLVQHVLKRFLAKYATPSRVSKPQDHQTGTTGEDLARAGDPTPPVDR